MQGRARRSAGLQEGGVGAAKRSACIGGTGWGGGGGDYGASTLINIYIFIYDNDMRILIGNLFRKYLI